MAITLVQSVSKSTNSGATLAIGAGDGWATPTVGNNLVVFANADDYFAAQPSGFTSRVNQGSPAFCGSICGNRISDGTETTVTVTPGSTVPIAMWLAEYSGMTATPFDVVSTVNARTSTSSADLDTNAATTTQADELLIAFWGSSRSAAGGVRSWSAQTNSFTEIVDIFTTAGAGTNVGLCLATRTVSATGAYNSVATPSADVAGNAFVTGWKAAGGAAAPNPLPPMIAPSAAVQRAASW